MSINHSADLTRISARKKNISPRWQRSSQTHIPRGATTHCEVDKTSPFQRKTKTLAFYKKHARQFCSSTLHFNLRGLYTPFLKELPPSAHILDAGCGSGRDTKAFLEKGYTVKAIDASPRLAQMATKVTGQNCQAVSFQDIDFHHVFDGIWACASLLHISHAEMPVVLQRFSNALKQDGILFVSLKEGHGERIVEDGRFFSYHTLKDFAALLAREGLFKTIRVWKTNAIDSSGQRVNWLNFIARKA